MLLFRLAGAVGGGAHAQAMDPGALLTVCMLVAALLYASVGHAGASGYLAAMSFLAVASATMKPTALILNVVVASIATVQFLRAGQFSWRIFWPFAVGSVPLAFIGSMLPVPPHIYRTLVGIVLGLSALKLLWDSCARSPQPAVEAPVRYPRWWVAVLCGAGLGFVAGLTGTGGGIFLSPLLLLMGWGRTVQSGGVAALFILLNSCAGLLGNPPDPAVLSPWMPLWIAAVIVGGTLGSYLGSRRAPPPIFKRLLVVVLLIASGKLIFT